MDTLSVPAVLDSLAAIRRFAKEVSARAGLDGDRSYQLQLALDEIATNIITYGYKDEGPSAFIAMRSEVRDNTLVITMEDRAPAFDPRTRRMPDAEELARPLDERPMGGLGIFLAVHGVDRFDYRREGDRNLTIFEVRIRQD